MMQVDSEIPSVPGFPHSEHSEERQVVAIGNLKSRKLKQNVWKR